MGKTLFQSKTVWFNLLYVIVVVAGLFGFKDYQPDATVVSVATGIQTLANILLRLITTKAITGLLKQG